MSSTCEIVYHFISMLGDENLIDYSISESLYAELAVGSLDSSTLPTETHNVVSKLLKWNISFGNS